MQIGNLFAAGGVVMYPLLGFSVLAGALILERLFFWMQVVRQQNRLVREALVLYGKSQKAAYMHLQKYSHIPIARIFLAALELHRPNPEEFRLALETAAQAEIPLLKRFNTVFETIISLSPLLGLLGTVLGLIQSFASLRVGEFGGGDTIGVSTGISEALISTAAGLIVAIFTLLFANLFRGLYLRQIALIQEYGGQLELLYRRQSEPGATYPYATP